MEIAIILLAVAIAALAAWLLWRHPDRVARFIFWLPAHLLYRIHVLGKENIPATGRVLFVCNHVSFIDAFLVFLAQKRLVRFLVWAPYARMPVLRWLMRLARVIPIDGTAGPRAILQSLREAS